MKLRYWFLILMEATRATSHVHIKISSIIPSEKTKCSIQQIRRIENIIQRDITKCIDIILNLKN